MYAIAFKFHTRGQSHNVTKINCSITLYINEIIAPFRLRTLNFFKSISNFITMYAIAF